MYLPICIFPSLSPCVDLFNTSQPAQPAPYANAQQTAYAAFDRTAGAYASTQSSASNNSQFNQTQGQGQNSAAAVPSAQGFGYNFPKAAPGGKDLWNERPNGSHGGIVPHSGPQAPSSLSYESSSNSNGANSSAFGADANAAALANTGSLGAGARPQYHVPGYSGFVRGEQFRFGDTYGKSTRNALNVPTDMPLEA